MSNEYTLKPSLVTQAMRLMIRAKRPLCLWGSPGTCKSQLVAQASAAEQLSLIDIRAVLLDPVDLRGLPHVNSDGRSHWAIPEFLPRDGCGVLFLDELNRAPQLVQNACFQLILDRKLGEYNLPDGWTIVSACNRESDGGGVTRMSSALANRFTHMTVEPDLDDWCKWAVGANVQPSVIAFLRFRSEYLHKFDRNERSYPTPRSWESVSFICNQQPAAEIELGLISGAVGYPAAIEFVAFLKLYRSLPSIDAILLNPTTAAVPSDVATQFAVSAALARRATDQNFGRVIQYLERLPIEYNVYTVRDATNRDSSLQSTAEFTNWSIKHSEVLN